MDFVAVLFILLLRNVRTALQAAVAYAVVHQARLALHPQVVPMLIQSKHKYLYSRNFFGYHGTFYQATCTFKRKEM
jgi:hypothetical protein